MVEDYPCEFCGWIDGEHASGCPYYADIPERCHTQGGGVVEYNKHCQRWVFVADPPMGFKVGDFMPEEWSIT